MLNSDLQLLSTYLRLLNTNQVILFFRSSCSLENIELESVVSVERAGVEPDQDEVGLTVATCVVETSNVCPVNVTEDFFERVDSCFLADPYVLSSWVKDKLGMVTSVKV